MHPLYLTMAIDNEDIHSLDTAISRYNAADCKALKAAYFATTVPLVSSFGP
jgi:hypothetical protein